MRTTLIIVALAAGCATTTSSDGSPKTKPQPHPDRSVEIQLSPLQQAMGEHWELATWVRDAVIAGQIDEVPQAAGLLGAHEPSPAVPNWTPFVDEMRAHARDAEHAEAIAEVADATAQIAVTCGKCHVETGAIVRIDEPAPVEGGSETVTHMRKHEWAAHAMWDGLVEPSDEKWLAGAELLGEQPLHQSEFFRGWLVTKEIATLGTKVHDIGVRARTADPDARGAIYGELITTCAECHSQLEAGP